MKCDELNTYNIEPLDATLYLKEDVDEAIAELKDKIQMHDFFWEGCGFDKLGFKNSIQVREYIDKLKAENERLKKENEHIRLRADNWKSLCFAGDENITELEKKFHELEGGTLILHNNEDLRWRKYPDEKPDVKVNECVCLLAVVEVQDDDKYRYVTEADYVLEDGEIPEGVFYRPYIGDEIEEDFVKADDKRYISKVIMWRPMPKAPEEALK